MNDQGTRDVYLPKGQWFDFWDGTIMDGNCWLRQVHSPLDRIPVFVRKGTSFKVNPEPVLCVDKMDMNKIVEIICDDNFKGIQYYLKFGI